MMKDDRSPARRSREEGFELSYRLARQQLAQISDLEEQCRKAGARYLGPGEIIIDYVGEPYRISVPNGDISAADGKTDVPLTDKIVILHYFVGAAGTPASGELITFKQLPGGISYYPAFFQRTVAPFVSRFGKRPELMTEVAARFGGQKAEYGDTSVTISAFDLVPVTLVLWRGDEELAPSGSILFDANISDYLPTEDVTVLCSTVVWKLVKAIPSA